jgi:hypothetical protein
MLDLGEGASDALGRGPLVDVQGHADERGPISGEESPRRWRSKARVQ